MGDLMSIIKVEVSIPEAVTAIKKFKENRMDALNQITNTLKQSLSEGINNLLKTEMELYLGEPDQSLNSLNGYKDKVYHLKGIGAINLKVPQSRKGSFNSSIVPNRERLDPRLKEDLAILHLSGISNRTLAMISKRILGVKISKDTVNKSLQLIEDQARSWLQRDLSFKKYWVLYIDGTNFNIQRRGSTEKEPQLVVLGIDEDGYRSVLAVEPGYKDSAETWRAVFKELKSRGLNTEAVQLGIMDGLPGLEKVFKEEFQQAQTARCWVHAMKNIMGKVPSRLREPFKKLLDKIMYSSSYEAAKVNFNELKFAMRKDAQRAVNCLEKDLESLLCHYKFEKSYWRALRTTNPIERINKELKRRTKSMESIGEKSLECVIAFTILKLEMGWQRNKVNSKHFDNLANVKQNVIESTVEKLLI